jgi:hypothetical protein
VNSDFDVTSEIMYYRVDRVRYDRAAINRCLDHLPDRQGESSGDIVVARWWFSVQTTICVPLTVVTGGQLARRSLLLPGSGQLLTTH